MLSPPGPERIAQESGGNADEGASGACPRRCRYSSMITAHEAWLTRRRRSNSNGKNDRRAASGSAAPVARGGRHSRSNVGCVAPSGYRCFMRFGADHAGQFGLDQRPVGPGPRRNRQRLVDRRRRLPDPLGHIALLRRVQNLEQGRLKRGHRMDLPHVELGGCTQRLTRWPLTSAGGLATHDRTRVTRLLSVTLTSVSHPHVGSGYVVAFRQVSRLALGPVGFAVCRNWISDPRPLAGRRAGGRLVVAG
jgi:hypothetical protein